MSSTYEFTVTLRGTGETPEEAWADATEAFATEPGEPETTTLVEEE